MDPLDALPPDALAVDVRPAGVLQQTDAPADAHPPGARADVPVDAVADALHAPDVLAAAQGPVAVGAAVRAAAAALDADAVDVRVAVAVPVAGDAAADVEDVVAAADVAADVVVAAAAVAAVEAAAVEAVAVPAVGAAVAVAAQAVVVAAVAVAEVALQWAATCAVASAEALALHSP